MAAIHGRGSACCRGGSGSKCCSEGSPPIKGTLGRPFMSSPCSPETSRTNRAMWIHLLWLLNQVTLAEWGKTSGVSQSWRPEAPGRVSAGQRSLRGSWEGPQASSSSWLLPVLRRVPRLGAASLPSWPPLHVGFSVQCASSLGLLCVSVYKFPCSCKDTSQWI